MEEAPHASALFRERARAWTDAVAVRRSRRSYTHDPLMAADLDALEAACRTFRPWPEARVSLLREAPDSIFMGILGSYGGVSGAPSALVFVGLRHRADLVGYTGEALMLEACARGLDTCWVGGLFSASHAASLVGVGAGEHVLAVSPVGHARESFSVKERVLFGSGRDKYRRRPEETAPGNERWPAWARGAVDAARLAPSAMNRQPWRFRLEDGALEVSFDGRDTPRVSKRLDCGIAMLHAELGAYACGVTGRWSSLDSPLVARFVPDL